METFEAISRLLNSYPTWAKLLFLLGLVVSGGTLVLAPRTLAESAAASNASSLVLRVHKVELFPANESASVQVTAIVNGTEFFYPGLSGVEWLKVAPSMAAQNFSLPKADSYELRFEMRKKEPGYDEAKLLSIDTITFNGPRAADSYALHGYDPASKTRSGSIDAQVVFSVLKK